MQGGHHPKLGVEYFEDLFRAIKARYRIHLHAMSPPEFVHIARVSRCTVEEALDRLIAAGLNSIPGGAPRSWSIASARQIAPHKATTDEWLGVMRDGARARPQDHGHHDVRPRRDRAPSASSTCCACASCRTRPAASPPSSAGRSSPGAMPSWSAQGGRLRVPAHMAISRLMLDNFDNMQTSFITQGAKIAQLGLFYAANDYGSACSRRTSCARPAPTA
jgi:cyclic dehypoxanthinyl futalosine synthase